MVTPDTVDYLRLHLLNVEGGTPVLKEVFLKEVKISSADGKLNIDYFLNCFKVDIDVLKNRCVISISAYNTLFPHDGSNTDIREWDVSLLSVVLLQCCTLDGKLDKLKRILNQEVQSSKSKQLDSFLVDNKVTIDSLRSTGDITVEQYDTLFPPSGTCLNDWDTDLLIVVLLKLCKPPNACKVIQTLREAVYIDVKLCDTSLNLDFFLKCNSKTIDAFRNESKITNSQYDQLYPKNSVHSDITNWDDDLLRIIVLHVCKTLPSRIISAVKTIRCSRNQMLAHRGNARIKHNDFLSRWMELYEAVKDLLDSVPHIKEVVLKEIKKFYSGDLDIQYAIDILKTSYLKDETANLVILSEISLIKKSFKQKIQQSEANIKEHIDQRNSESESIVLRCIDELKDLVLKERTYPQYKCVRKIPGFRAELCVSSNDEETVADAEQIMLAELNANPRTGAFEQLAKGIEGEDTKIKNVTSGSVILYIQCESTAALLTCLQYYESGRMQESALPIQALLRRTLSRDLEISIHLNENDLAHIRDVIVSDIEDETYNAGSDDELQRSIHLLLECNSLDGLYRVWESFRSGDVANNLNIVSEELSTRLGRPVKVSASINFEEFKSAFESAENNRAVAEAFTTYSKGMQREQDQHTFADVEALVIAHVIYFGKANKVFKDIAVHGTYDSFWIMFKNQVESEYERIKIADMQASMDISKHTLDELYQDVNQKITIKHYLRPGGYQEYTADVKQLQLQYTNTHECLGRQKFCAYLRFVKGLRNQDNIIRDADAQLTKIEEHKVAEALNTYRSGMETGMHPYADEEALNGAHEQSIEKAIQVFMEIEVCDDMESFKKDMENQLNREYEQIKQADSQASMTISRQTLDILYRGVTKKVADGHYFKLGGCMEYTEAVEQIRTEYNDTPNLGRKKDQMYRLFLEERQNERTMIDETETRLRMMVTEALNTYRSGMEREKGKHPYTDDDALDGAHAKYRGKAMQAFMQITCGNLDSLKKDVEDMVNGEYKRINEADSQTSMQISEQKLENLYWNVNKNVADRHYHTIGGYKEYTADVAKIGTIYNRTPHLGRQKNQAYTSFVEKRRNEMTVIHNDEERLINEAFEGAAGLLSGLAGGAAGGIVASGALAVTICAAGGLGGGIVVGLLVSDAAIRKFPKVVPAVYKGIRGFFSSSETKPKSETKKKK